MALKLANNATSTLASSIDDTQTSISVQTGDAARFPSLGAGDWFPATLVDASGNVEVVKVTARSGATLTVVRGQEGTVTQAFASGSRIELRMTASALAHIETPGAIDGAASQAAPDDADEFGYLDKSAGAFVKWAWSQTKTAIWTALGALIAGGTSKATPVDGDALSISDSAATNATKKLTWANLKATLFASWGALIAGGTSKTTPVDADAILLSDSAASNASKKLTWANLKATLKTYFDGLYVATGEAVPAGAVASFAQSSAPTGWLKCNGAAVSRSTYAALFSAIGTTFGAGNGSTTFNLPDLRGEFDRGWDDGRGVDSGRAFGSAQADAIESHTHTASTSSAGSHTHSGSTGSAGAHTHGLGRQSGGGSTTAPEVPFADGNVRAQTTQTDSAGSHSHSVSISTDGAHTHTVTVNAAGSAETRPRNIALLKCIKY